jgi:hypothetical protein
VRDLGIALDDRPGALAHLGEALARDGVSIEGGGVFHGVAHYLFEDGDAARAAVERAGLRVVEDSAVLQPRLRQSEPGQLGKIARRFAEAGVNIRVQYSDHDHRLVLVVADEDFARGQRVCEAWARNA